MIGKALPVASPPDSPRVYISSPLGFSEFGRVARTWLHGQLEGAGILVVDPWGWPDRFDPRQEIATPDLLGAARIAPGTRDLDVSKEIAARNITELRRADVVLAILDGADVDSGVAAEVGFAAAHEKPIVGLRSDERRTADSDGYSVNLQVHHLILHFGSPAGRIVTSLAGAIAAIRDLAATPSGELLSSPPMESGT